MAPELFKPAPGEVKWEGPRPTAPAAAEAVPAQEAAQEAPAGQEAAAPEATEGPASPEPKQAGQITITHPPGQEPPGPQSPATPAADATSGGAAPAEGLPVDVLLEAGRAGLSPEDIVALQSADAIRTAIRYGSKLSGQPAATSTTAAQTAAATASAGTAAAGTIPQPPPALKPWELALPKEFEDETMFDPKVVGYLKQVNQGLKERDDAYRASFAHLEGRQAPVPENTAAQNVSELMFDMTLNQTLAQEANKPYAEKLGIGWQAELTDEEFANRQKVASVAQELHAQAQAQGRRPKLAELVMQAAGVVFPEIATKLGQKTLLTRVAARPKVGRPGGGVADTRDATTRANDAIREAQRAAGIR